MYRIKGSFPYIRAANSVLSSKIIYLYPTLNADLFNGYVETSKHKMVLYRVSNLIDYLPGLSFCIDGQDYMMLGYYTFIN